MVTKISCGQNFSACFTLWSLPVGIHYRPCPLEISHLAIFSGGELQFVHSLSVRIGCPSSLAHRSFRSSPCTPCFLLLPGSHHIFQENAKKNPKRQRDSSRIGCVNARSIPFSRTHQIRQQIQVTFYHSFFDTHSGFCFGFELLF